MNVLPSGRMNFHAVFAVMPAVTYVLPAPVKSAFLTTRIREWKTKRQQMNLKKKMCIRDSIYNAIKRDALLENVTLDKDGKIDFDDKSVTCLLYTSRCV